MWTTRYFVLLTASLSLYSLCHSSEFDDEDEPPSFVYRSDFRPPSEVFQNGIKNLGENQDLLDHVSGISCTTGSKKDTAFVATSLSEEAARGFGLGNLWTSRKGRRHIYLYKIRATEFFYDIQASLKKAYKETGNLEYLDMADKFKAEKEWVAFHGIHRNQIMSAKVYMKDVTFGRGIYLRTETNELYISENTRGNRDVFPINGLPQTVSLIPSNSPGPVTGCFATDCSSTVQARFSSGEACTREIGFETSLSSEKGSFWDSISNRYSKGLLPWKEAKSNRGGHVIEMPEECTIDAGDIYDVKAMLTISCPRNRFYERFRVYLKGGMGPRTLFQTKHMEGVSGRPWTKAARHIRMGHGRGTLEDEGYTMNDVFADKYRIWWTEIKIYPLYPIIRS